MSGIENNTWADGYMSDTIYVICLFTTCINDTWMLFLINTYPFHLTLISQESKLTTKYIFLPTWEVKSFSTDLIFCSYVALLHNCPMSRWRERGSGTFKLCLSLISVCHIFFFVNWFVVRLYLNCSIFFRSCSLIADYTFFLTHFWRLYCCL